MTLASYEANLGRGDRLVFVAAKPGADHIELLVAEPRDAEQGVELWVTRGYKAGLVFQVLPRECRPAPRWELIDVQWLRANWNDIVQGACGLDEVEVYPEGS